MVFTAPYLIDGNAGGGGAGKPAASEPSPTEAPHPGFDSQHATDFFKKHGMAVRAIGT